MAHDPYIEGKDGVPLNHTIINHLYDDLDQWDLSDLEHHSLGRRLGPVVYEKPVIAIDDLPKLIAWAQGKVAEYNGAPTLDYTRRAIGTVQDAQSIFGPLETGR